MTFQNIRGISDCFQHHTNLCSRCSISL